MKKTEKRRWMKRMGLLFFCVYLVILLYLVFLSEYYGRTETGRTYRYNLVLFREINRFIRHRESLGTMAVLTNLAGNVVAFIPFGFLIPLLYCKKRGIFPILLSSFSLSLGIEIIQLIFKVGCFDVDDLFLNTLGGCIGYLGFWITHRIWRKYDEKKVV